MSLRRERGPAERVQALRKRVASLLALASVAGSLAALGGVLALAWAGAQFGVLERPSPWPLFLWLAGLGGLGVWLWWNVSRLARWDLRAAAAEIERSVDLPRGSVEGAIEEGLEGPGISRALVDLHRRRLGRRLAGIPVAELGDQLAARARVGARLSASLAAGVAIALIAVWSLAPGVASEAWGALLHPVRTLSALPLPPLVLTGASERVRRGEDLAVLVTAPVRDSVRLFWRPQGEVVRERWLMVGRAGIARSVVPSIEAPTEYWARAIDGAVTDTLNVEPVDPLLLIDVQVTLRYPAHTRRDLEIISSPLPVMTVPAGTWTKVTAKATQSISRAALRSNDGRTIRFEVRDDRTFVSTFTVRDGVWSWDISGLEGDSLQGPADTLHFITVADSVPTVRIVYPGADTLLGTDMVQPLLIDLRDDYGLSAAELVSWRVSVWGERWPETVEALALADDDPRASLTSLLDARGRGLLPGDTLHYFVRAYDNAPEAQMGRSREYILRLPDLDELRQRTLAQADGLLESVEGLAERARAQQEAAETLQRATEVSPLPGINPGDQPEEEGVAFRETEAARQALDEASSLLQQAEEIQKELRQLQEAIERSGLNDETVLERLREIEALYDRLLTPELEEKIQQLREALAELDPEQIREAIRQLAEGGAEFRQRVEQSVELLRRAVMEQEFTTLETQAAELADEHRQLADAAEDAAASADSAAAEALQRAAENLAQKTDSLAERIGDFAGELDEAGEMQAGERAAEAQRSASAASRADAKAAEQMQSSQSSAAQSSRQAQQQMQQASSSLQQGRQAMQEDWRQEVVAALDRTRAETLELARRQRELNDRTAASDESDQGELRSEQVAMKRGLDQIQQQLSETMESTLLINPALLDAAAQTVAAMEQLLEQLGDGTRRRRASSGLGTRVSEGLNELAFRLMEASEAASSARSGTGMQEALEQLAQLAEQQGQLNAQSGGLSPSGLTQAMMQQLGQLGSQQRGIARELQQLDQSVGPRGQVLGELDALAQEAGEIADDLEAGRLDEQLIERQRELFQKLLDAGRTLEQDEFDRERRAERPTTAQILRPEDLPAELTRGRQYPHPDAEALREFPPAFRRLILEYFDRLNRLNGADDGS